MSDTDKNPSAQEQQMSEGGFSQATQDSQAGGSDKNIPAQDSQPIAPAYWFVFHGEELMLSTGEGGQATVPLSIEPPTRVDGDAHIFDAGTLNGSPVRAYSIGSREDIGQGRELCNLRKSFYRLPRGLYDRAGKCRELLYWDSNSLYCGHCGAPMRMHTAISKVCTGCGREIWPQLATAVIVLIHRGDELLLVSSRNFKRSFYGLVAGFVETGESLEEAVRREVMEETGIRIKNLAYWDSQPWPYPCGLMAGFTAEYDGGELRLQEEELSRGGWFPATSLPTLPEKLSIARRLIDNFLEQNGFPVSAD